MKTLKQQYVNFNLKKLSIFGTLIFGLFILNGCNYEQAENKSNELYSKFQNPDAEAKPMVRWWWNGNAVEANEIKRQLAVMSDAGIGGVEINSIAMPPTVKNIGQQELDWAGKEWCNMVKVASLEAKRLGMITDLIVGSGWPFGGKFLNKEDIIQKLGVKEKFVAANSQVNIDFSEFLEFRRQNAPGSKEKKKYSDIELISVKLLPIQVNELGSIIDISSYVKDNN